MADRVMFLCPRCDNVYYEVSGSEFDSDREGHERKAKRAKRSHLCPWMRKRKQQNK